MGESAEYEEQLDAGWYDDPPEDWDAPSLYERGVPGWYIQFEAVPATLGYMGGFWDELGPCKTKAGLLSAARGELRRFERETDTPCTLHVIWISKV